MNSPAAPAIIRLPLTTSRARELPVVTSAMNEEPMALSPDLLSILVCPACRGDLAYDEGARTLTCPACRLRYRVVDDIANMLVDEAEKI